jgi:hypothetical protein
MIPLSPSNKLAAMVVERLATSAAVDEDEGLAVGHGCEARSLFGHLNFCNY